MTDAAPSEEIIAFNPHWCLFWARGVTWFHLAIWLPHLRRSRYRYVLMAGESSPSPRVREMIAGIPNIRILEPYSDARRVLKQAKAFKGFLYMGTRPLNFAVVNAFAPKLHVWLGHGESDKVYNRFRTASLYDSLFVARYGVVKRYPRAIRSWVRRGACAIGTPILDGALKAPWPQPRQVRTILYAPTWEGHVKGADYSTLDVVGRLLIAAMPDLAARGIKVILRPHPVTGVRLPELKEIRDALLAAGAIPGSSDKSADFNEADIMISDISGVTAEFLFTEKPIVMPLTPVLVGMGKDDDRLRQEYPWAYRWHPDTESLLAMLDRLAREDPLKGARANGASTMFRGHRTVEEAARTFDLALSSVWWRKTPVPVWIPFELKRWRAKVLRW